MNEYSVYTNISLLKYVFRTLIISVGRDSLASSYISHPLSAASNSFVEISPAFIIVRPNIVNVSIPLMTSCSSFVRGSLIWLRSFFLLCHYVRLEEINVTTFRLARPLLQ